MRAAEEIWGGRGRRPHLHARPLRVIGDGDPGRPRFRDDDAPRRLVTPNQELDHAARAAARHIHLANCSLVRIHGNVVDGKDDVPDVQLLGAEGAALTP